MNVRLALSLFVAAATSLFGCSSGDGSGSGGGGGTGGATSAATSSSTATASSSSTSSSGGGCTHCADLSKGMGDPGNLCTDNSPPTTQIWAELQTCICAKACPMECGDNLCVMMAPSDACTTCLGDTGGILAACPTEANACVGDL